ncbi:MAG: ABC transporter permease [Bacteroidetes bacterium]|nr:ABC transporter permease [Bacteroidota bacterium]
MFHNPPKIAEKLLRFLLRKQDKEIILGDIEEIYNDVVTDKGLWFGMLWYWFHIIKSIIPVIYKSTYWGVAMFKNYLKITYRNILRNKVYTFINIFGLATGLAAFVLITLYVQHELSYDRYHKNADRIFRVIREKPNGEAGTYTRTSVTPAPLAPLMLEELPEVLNASRLIKSNDILITQGEKHFVEDRLFWADYTVFDIFDIPFVRGESKTALNNPYSIVLSEDMAGKYFGMDDPVGQVLTLFENTDFRVAGVFKNMPANSHFVMDFITPYKTYFLETGQDINSWGGNFSYSYIQLKENINENELEAKFPSFLDKFVYAGFDIGDKFKQRIKMQPLTDIHLYSHLNQEIEANSDITYIILFSSTALLFLLIACINYMNLATARSGQRGREVGIRKVIGAKRQQLIKQFLFESIALTFISMILSLVIVLLSLSSFNTLIERQLTFNPVSNSEIAISVFLLSLFIGLFAGSYPAFRLSGFKPVSIIGGGFTKSAKGLALRNVMVLTQFTITIVLFALTFIVDDQVSFIKNKDMGYSREQIINLEVQDHQIRKNYQVIKNELEQSSDIIAISSSESLPHNIDMNTSLKWTGKDPDEIILTYYNMSDYDFIELYDIEILEGRNFSREFVSDNNGAFLVNEAAVKAAGWETAIGKELIHWSGEKANVVGVMKDFHLHSLHRPIAPLYIFLDTDDFNYISIKINTNNIAATTDYIKSVIEKYSPNYPVHFTFFDDNFNKIYKTEQKMTTIFSAFAMMAIIVACLGLFGLSTFAAEQRTKEFGIRKTLGASIPALFLLLSKEFFKWVLLANIFAWPIAYFSIRSWLDGFVYRTEIGIWVFILSGLIALIVALITISRQAYKAASINPIDSLKYE